MKLLEIYTNEDERISSVEIKHKGETYKGYAACHPDDNWSNFTGCQFAELRATKKALKNEYKKKKYALEQIEKFIHAIEQYKVFNKEDGTAKALYRQYNRRLKEVEIAKNDIEAINTIIRARINSLNALQKRKEDKKS